MVQIKQNNMKTIGRKYIPCKDAEEGKCYKYKDSYFKVCEVRLPVLDDGLFVAKNYIILNNMMVCWKMFANVPFEPTDFMMEISEEEHTEIKKQFLKLKESLIKKDNNDDFIALS